MKEDKLGDLSMELSVEVLNLVKELRSKKENIISNQIEINKIATRRALSVKLSAFPKLAVNSEFVSNADALEKIGSTIKLQGGASLEDVRKAVGYLNPASMSVDAKNLQDDLKDYTKDLEGAGDVATGTVDPTQASGKAILAVQQATREPLNEQVNTYKTFLEDEARIWYDMWKAYQVAGIQVMYEQDDGMGGTVEVPGRVPYEVLNKLDTNIKVEITPKSPYDIYAQEQSIENLLNAGHITYEEYVDLLPDGSAMPKYELQKKLQERQKKQAMIDQMQLQVEQEQSKLQQAMMQQDNTMSSIDSIQNEANGMQQQLMQQLGGGANELSEMPVA